MKYIYGKLVFINLLKLMPQANCDFTLFVLIALAFIDLLVV